MHHASSGHDGSNKKRCGGLDWSGRGCIGGVIGVIGDIGNSGNSGNVSNSGLAVFNGRRILRTGYKGGKRGIAASGTLLNEACWPRKVAVVRKCKYTHEAPLVRTFEDCVGIGNLLIGEIALGTQGLGNGGIVAFHPGISVDGNPIRGSVASKALCRKVSCTVKG